MSDEKPRPWHSFLATSLTILVIVAALAGLNVLLLGTMGLVLLVAGGVCAVVILHYVVWGWWLGPAIHRDTDAEEDDNQRF